MVHLKDPSLLRQQAFLNGKWCDADNGETCSVANPATGEIIGTVPNMGAAETRRNCRRRGGVGWLARKNSEGTQRHSSQME